MCKQSKDAFGDVLDFQEKGGMKAFGDSMDNGMVLVLSLWDDFEAHMLWLDSDYPLDRVNIYIFFVIPVEQNYIMVHSLFLVIK